MTDYLSLGDEILALVVCSDSNRWDFRSRGIISINCMETDVRMSGIYCMETDVGMSSI